jgi:hypothetical protein
MLKPSVHELPRFTSFSMAISRERNEITFESTGLLRVRP